MHDTNSHQLRIDIFVLISYYESCYNIMLFSSLYSHFLLSHHFSVDCFVLLACPD